MVNIGSIRMDNIDKQTSKVLFYVERIMQKSWATATEGSISVKTKRSQRIIKLWQYLCARYLKLNIGNPNTASLEFAVHDKINGIIYELKATDTNPRTPLFKTVCKAIAYNQMYNDRVKEIIFIIPKSARSKIWGSDYGSEDHQLTIPELLMKERIAGETRLEIKCFNRKNLVKSGTDIQ